MKDGESLQPLGSGISVIVNDEHHFFTDTILLAHFAAPKKTDKAVDLGTGCGTIPLLWNRFGAPAHTYAIEIQKNGADMAQRSVELNNLQDKITVINADMNHLNGVLPKAQQDLVVCNPPYKPVGTGILSTNSSHAVIRHETHCTINDTAKAAATLLRFGGRLCLCLRPERLTEVIVAMRSNRIEPKRLRMVQQRTQKPPKLFLIEGRFGGNSGGLTVLPTLLIEKDCGGYSDEMISIYGSYKEGTGDNKI